MKLGVLISLGLIPGCGRKKTFEVPLVASRHLPIILTERKALELAKHRLVEEDLRAMLERNRLPEGRQDDPKIDDRLHTYLIEKAGNPYIADFFARHGKYYEMVFDWESLDRAAAVQTVEQHREILEALIARQWEAAGDRLENHIRHNHPVLKQLATGHEEVELG